MTSDVTRLEVRRVAIAYVVMTLATSVAVVLGAGIPLVLAVAGLAFLATMSAVEAVATSAAPKVPGQQARWTFLLFLGFLLGFLLGEAWFPRLDYICGPTQRSVTIDQQVVVFCQDFRLVDVPANLARSLILAGALGLAAWLVVLILPLQRYPALARLEDWGSGQARPEIAPGENGDLLLSLLAIAAVLVPPMGAMDELTSPFGWPTVQIAAAFLLTLPLIKRRSLDGALIVYRITFVAYAVLLARLAIGTATTLTLQERVILVLAFAGVLVASLLGYRRTSRLSTERSGGLRSGVVP